jgi:hypothetical protein
MLVGLEDGGVRHDGHTREVLVEPRGHLQHTDTDYVRASP